MIKKFLSGLVALCMVVAVLQVGVMAASETKSMSETKVIEYKDKNNAANKTNTDSVLLNTSKNYLIFDIPGNGGKVSNLTLKAPVTVTTNTITVKCYVADEGIGKRTDYSTYIYQNIYDSAAGKLKSSVSVDSKGVESDGTRMEWDLSSVDISEGQALLVNIQRVTSNTSDTYLATSFNTNKPDIELSYQLEEAAAEDVAVKDYSLEDGTASLKITAKDGLTGLVGIVGVYNGNVLTNAVIKTIVAGDEGTDFSVAVPNGQNIKVFVFESISNLKPMLDSAWTPES